MDDRNLKVDAKVYEITRNHAEDLLAFCRQSGLTPGIACFSLVLAARTLASRKFADDTIWKAAIASAVERVKREAL